MPIDAVQTQMVGRQYSNEFLALSNSQIHRFVATVNEQGQMDYKQTHVYPSPPKNDLQGIKWMYSGTQTGKLTAISLNGSKPGRLQKSTPIPIPNGSWKPFSHYLLTNQEFRSL